MMRSLWKSVHGVSAIRTVGEWVSVIALMAFMFFLIFAMASGFGRPPDVKGNAPEPDPVEIKLDYVIEQLEQQGIEIKLLQEEVRDIKQEQERILGINEVSMTAYCSCSACCYPYADGITATGALAIAGDGSRDNPHPVAVDPRVIPLGSWLYIQGYGHGVAIDTGGAIKGNRIDILMGSHKVALDFGRQNVRVVWYA